MNKKRTKKYVKEALSLRLSLQNTKGLKSYEKYEEHLKTFLKVSLNIVALINIRLIQFLIIICTYHQQRN